jgi:hypothetical protein
MRKAGALIFWLFVATFSRPGFSAADPVVIAAFDTPPFTTAVCCFGGAYQTAISQNFVTEEAGIIRRADVLLFAAAPPDGDMTLSVYRTQSGLPVGVALGTVTVPAALVPEHCCLSDHPPFVSFAGLSTFVKAGDALALVMDGTSQAQWVSGSGVYAHGFLAARPHDSSEWHTLPQSGSFRVFADPIPEPGSMLMMAAGLLGLLRRRTGPVRVSKGGPMSRHSLVVAGVALFCLGVASQAAAEPVTVTGGSIVFSEPSLPIGSMSINGTRGFSVNGSLDTGEGRADPLVQCFPCSPTPDFSVGLEFFGSAILGAVATLDGNTYADFDSPSSANFMFLQLDGSTELPPVNGPSITIRAPFTLHSPSKSFFQFEIAPGTATEPPVVGVVPLEGKGIATVNFQKNPNAPVWEFSSARYDFQTTSTTPEPATLFLIGGALAVLRGARRSRNPPHSNPI